MFKEFFASTMATAFEDPRVNLVHDDAAQFVKREGHATYDVIIVDSTDPVGPAATLFEESFYANMKLALNPQGVICCQGECLWLHMDLIGRVLGDLSHLFPTVEYAFTTIPTYPSGQIGFFLMANDERDGAMRLPDRQPSPEVQAQLKYYNPQVTMGSDPTR